MPEKRGRAPQLKATGIGSVKLASPSSRFRPDRRYRTRNEAQLLNRNEAQLLNKEEGGIDPKGFSGILSAGDDVQRCYDASSGHRATPGPAFGGKAGDNTC